MLATISKTNCLKKLEYPSLIKYMGSKSKIMDFVIDGINQVNDQRPICDLFAGSCSLAGAIGQQSMLISNDIQTYTRILADTYNQSYTDPASPSAEHLIEQARTIVEENRKAIEFDYSAELNLTEFSKLEEMQKILISESFDYKWHLFAKNYSGTWWSYDQCLWIDALREVAERYRASPIYPAIISSIMFSMAYVSQGTGHYAQYRDAKTTSSFRDILIYRKRSIAQYFERKYSEVLSYIPNEPIALLHQSTTLDYRQCLERFEGGTVYADPPYCFVHYSRFYHALETLVLYDFPNLQVQRGQIVKGRYREDRHQSPFCIKSQVQSAFISLFEGVKKSNSSLALSYSNTGMISLDDLVELCKQTIPDCKIDFSTTDHNHMTMGRREDRQRSVKEGLLLVHAP